VEIIYQNRRGIPPLAYCCHLVLVVGCSDLFPHLGAHRLLQACEIVAFIYMEPNKVIIRQVILFLDYVKLQSQGVYCSGRFIEVCPKVFT